MSDHSSFSRASQLLYSLAKQGTHQQAIRVLLSEQGISDADIKQAVEAYAKEERTGAIRAIVTGTFLLVISVALTVITLMPSIRVDFVRLWPWGFLAGVWLSVTGGLRLKRLVKFQRT
jgi:hypothetical protein